MQPTLDRNQHVRDGCRTSADLLLFSPLLANLVLAVCMLLAALATLPIKETFIRSAKDREEGEGLLPSTPETFMDSPPLSPTFDKSPGCEQDDEVSINKVSP